MSFFFRIFVTNSLSFLPECDEILLLENGRVTLNGHYNQLIKNSPTFTKFISSYFQTFDENDQNANEPSQHQQQQQTNGDTSANKSSTIRQRATESLITTNLHSTSNNNKPTATQVQTSQAQYASVQPRAS